MAIIEQKKEEKFSFYYDESEHSRKINQKTIEADNYSNNFMTVIIGYSNNDKGEIEKKFNDFKENYEDRLINGELKSTSIKLKYGFSSLNKQNLKFITDFFDVIGDKALVYFSVNNKIEYIVNQLFINYKNSCLFNMDSLKYTISKTISVYRPENVIRAIYDEGDLINELKLFFQSRIAENGSIKLKELESNALKQIMILLNNYNTDIKLDWDYSVSFEGFKKYLIKNQITNYRLILDNEGKNNKNSKTLIAAEKAKLLNVSEEDSKNQLGIQIADILVGIISKIIKALESDGKYKNYEEFTQKKILSDEWFNLNDYKLNLYKRLYHLLFQDIDKLNYSYGIYADELVRFKSLLEYFNNFKDIKQYLEVNKKMHSEYVNTLTCKNLKKYFEYWESN